jgi:hypothetical protein
MTTEQQTRPWIRLSTAVLAGAGLALSAFGLAVGTAQAAPAPAPTYHWCPGDRWDQGWGNNWDWNHCHDWGPAGPVGYVVPPPWAPPPPAPPIWAPWASVAWNPDANAWGFWNNGVWMGI